MDCLPEDIQNIIWKKVYDGVVDDINKGYIAFRFKRISTLLNDIEKCNKPYNSYIDNTVKRFSKRFLPAGVLVLIFKVAEISLFKEFDLNVLVCDVKAYTKELKDEGYYDGNRFGPPYYPLD